MADGATFDTTLDRLTAIVDHCRAAEDRVGYFAVMYRVVTRTVRRRAGQGRFEDAARMERFVSTFAARYLDAHDAWRAGLPCTTSWRAAFDVTRWRHPVVVQHLLLGMNAHINLDLGIVAAQLDPARGIEAVHADFDAINDVLAELIEGCQGALDEVSPWFGLVDRVGGRTDEQIIRFSLERARRQAWSAAERLSTMSGARLDAEIAAIDAATAGVAYVVAHPGWTVSAALAVVRMREWTSPAKVIDVLDAVQAKD